MELLTPEKIKDFKAILSSPKLMMKVDHIIKPLMARNGITIELLKAYLEYKSSDVAEKYEPKCLVNKSDVP
jgi:hypothetical protein